MLGKATQTYFMKNTTLQQSTLTFLSNLAQNNNREWFNEHKNEYLQAHQNLCDIVDLLIVEMNKHDVIENESGKKSLYRIYSDTRFSKDKTPYNPRFAFGFRRATAYRRGGYYVHIEPNNSFVGCGFFAPNADDLIRIREDIDYNYEDWFTLLKTPSIGNTYGNITGNSLATAPKGYPKDHPGIALLRHKQFIFKSALTENDLLSGNLVQIINEKLKDIRPFFDYMSDLLTTNANGEPLF